MHPLIQTDLGLYLIHDPVQDDPPDMTPTICPGCSSRNVALEDGDDGALICRNCGTVLEEQPMITSAFGLTRVNLVGRSFDTVHRMTAVSHGSGRHINFRGIPGEAKRSYRARRQEQIRHYLSGVAHRHGLTSVGISRTLFLWKKAMSLLDLKFWAPAEKAVLACLYIVTKESAKGISLVQLAAQTNRSPFTIGASLKLIKAEFLRHHVLPEDHPCFKTDDDPWIFLEKILYIGPSHAGVNLPWETLPSDIQKVLGFAQKLEDKNQSLKKLLISAQKCMTIALDAGLVTGRPLQTVVAACLIVAIEVRLMLPKAPHELFVFLCAFYSTHLTSVRLRYKELRAAILVWAQRLPFGPKGKIKDNKLIFFMDDVFKYFGHLEAQNESIWKVLDKSATEAQEEEADEQGPGGWLTLQDLEDEKMLLQGGPLQWDDEAHSVNGEQSQDASPEHGADPLSPSSTSGKVTPKHVVSARPYPPAFVASQERREQQLERIQLIKNTDRPSILYNEPGLDKEGSKIAQVATLLRLGFRTEDEIATASEITMSRWVQADEARIARLHVHTAEELDSATLTSKDMTEKEIAFYLTSKQGTEARVRVLGQSYLSADTASLVAAKAREERQAKVTAVQGTKRARVGQGEDATRPNKAIVRSSKLCLEALAALKAEDPEADLEEEGQTFDTEQEVVEEEERAGHKLDVFETDDLGADEEECEEEEGWAREAWRDYEDEDSYNYNDDYD